MISGENSNGIHIFFKKDSLASIVTINQNYKIHAKKLGGTIKLDEIINEDDWLKAEKADNFYMTLPYDTGHSAAKSEIMMAYDEKAFYLGQKIGDQN